MYIWVVFLLCGVGRKRRAVSLLALYYMCLCENVHFVFYEVSYKQVFRNLKCPLCFLGYMVDIHYICR